MTDLESIYAAARQARAAKEYDRARELLKQIVAEDETYKDASKLLAELVARERRRWYNDVRLWSAAAVVVLVVIGIAVASALPAVLPRATEMPTAIALAPTATGTATLPLPTNTSIVTPSPTPTVTPSVTPTQGPTVVPFTWKRLYTGQEFLLDSYDKMVLDPRDPDIIYMSSVNTGVYKTIDGGISWQPANNGLGTTVVQTLVIDPKDPHILYVGLNRAGVFKTTDGGVVWRSVNQGIEVLGGLSQIVMDPNNNRHLFYATNVFATTANAFYESLDAGDHWSQVKESTCPNNNSALVSHPSDSKTLFIVATQSVDPSCDGGIYKSLDAGRTWGLVGLKNNSINQLFVSPKTGNVLYAQSGNGTYGSTDGGNTWNLIRGYSGILTFDWNGNAVITPGGSPPTLRSVDNGKTWQPLYATTTDGNSWRFNGLRGDYFPRVVQFPPDARQTVYFGGAGFAVSSDDGASWTERSNGLAIGKHDLISHPSSALFLYPNTMADAYISTNGGRSWGTFPLGRTRGMAFDAGGKIVYRSEPNSFRKYDMDSKQVVAGTKMPTFEQMRIAAHPRQPGLVYATFYSGGAAPYVYFSPDGGGAWQKASGMQSMSDVALYFDYDQGQTMYAISSGVYASRSKDAGRTWENCGNLNAPDATRVILYSSSESRLIVDPRNSNRLLAATRGNGVVVSDDGCKTWAASNMGLGNLFVITLAIDPKNPNRVYAGTDGGAFLSNDSGKSWFQVNDGLLGATVIYSIVVDSADPSNVFAATPYGIFKLENK